MDIYILRDGEQIGPFSKDAAQILIDQGTVSKEDLAWREGTPDWRPLGQVVADALLEVSDSPEAPPIAAPERSTEPATAAQIAFLSYFSIAIPAGLLKDDADGLITAATADPQNAKRLESWEVDRVRLHPDLFSTGAVAKKEDRVQLFFDLCQTAGADHFTGVTKAHCQVLVAFLDVKFPRWDADEAAATERYFFPAMGEKFPQLVNKAWRGRLHYGDGASAAARKSNTTKLVKNSASPGWAIVRGIVFGLFILAVLYLVYFSRQQQAGKRQQRPVEKVGVGTAT